MGLYADTSGGRGGGEERVWTRFDSGPIDRWPVFKVHPVLEQTIVAARSDRTAKLHASLLALDFNDVKGGVHRHSSNPLRRRP